MEKENTNCTEKVAKYFNNGNDASNSSVEIVRSDCFESRNRDVQKDERINTSQNAQLEKSVNQIKKYKDLVEIMRKVTPTQRLTTIFQECLKYFHFSLSMDKQEILMKKVKKFHQTFASKWKKSHQTFHVFQKNESVWLESFITVPEEWFSMTYKNLAKSSGRKRKRSPHLNPDGVPGKIKQFKDLKTREKQKVVQGITQQLLGIPTTVVLQSTQQVLAKRGEKEKSLLLKKILKSTDTPKELLLKLKKNEPTAKTYTPDEALALMLEIGISKKSYQTLRTQGVDRNFKIYPSYLDVLTSKKNCYPLNIMVTETIAKVPFQDLLNHTVQRLCSTVQSNFTASIQSNESNFYTLVGIYGFDGSSGHSRYHQNFGDESMTKTDETLFATTFIPQQILSSNNQLIWENPSPNSIRYCRPLKLEFTKETTEKIIQEKTKIELEIKNLKDTELVIGDMKILIKYDLRLTMIDGKCLMAVTGVTKSSQSCPLCGAKPKEFNIEKNLQNSTFEPKPGTLVFGISPLHCWIRLFEFCLKLAYRKPAGVYPVGKAYKSQYEETKRQIQTKLRESMGILVDVVKQGAGTTNNGNMARKAFRKYKEFSTILKIDSKFVKNLYIILVTISSHLPINLIKFGEFCTKTFKHYVSKYAWHPMSVSLHKVLVHGAAIVKSSILPLNMTSEEAAESRNKFYRHDREFHARKTNRLDNLKDIFHRALETSDPVISNYFCSSRKNSSQHFELPPEALELIDESLDFLNTSGSNDLENPMNVFDLLDEFELENNEEELDDLQ